MAAIAFSILNITRTGVEDIIADLDQAIIKAQQV